MINVVGAARRWRTILGSSPAARVTVVDVVAALATWALGQRMRTLIGPPPASLLAAVPAEDATTAPSADDIVIADQSLASAWKHLRARDREVLALAVFEDLPVSSIASSLGVSANAVSIRLHRAKKVLADLLAN